MEQGGFGPAAATWPGLRDWNEMMRHALRPWELLAIARMAHVRAMVHSEKIAAETKKKGKGNGINRDR